LSAKDVVSLSNSDIVFMIGHEQIDGFLKKPAADKKQIFLGDGIKLIEVSEHTDDKH
jgi:ABC-type Zn uptake system ZnuABC Zn-binding protein ZnuA